MYWLCMKGQKWLWFVDNFILNVLFLYILKHFLNCRLILPNPLAQQTYIPRLFLPVPPRKSLWKIIGVQWECYWFGLGVLREKVSFIFSKIKTKEEKIARILKCFHIQFVSVLLVFHPFYVVWATCLLLSVIPLHFCPACLVIHKIQRQIHKSGNNGESIMAIIIFLWFTIPGHCLTLTAHPDAEKHSKQTMLVNEN